MSLLNVMHGNRALLKVAGKAIGAGLVQDFSADDNYSLQDISGLGDPEVQEHVPGLVTHTLSLSKAFIYNKSLRALGIVPTSERYLDPPRVDVEIVDKVTGAVVEHYVNATVESHGRSYGKHTVSAERMTLRALHKEA